MKCNTRANGVRTPRRSTNTSINCFVVLSTGTGKLVQSYLTEIQEMRRWRRCSLNDSASVKRMNKVTSVALARTGAMETKAYRQRQSFLNRPSRRRHRNFSRNASVLPQAFASCVACFQTRLVVSRRLQWRSHQQRRARRR